MRLFCLHLFCFYSFSVFLNVRHSKSHCRKRWSLQHVVESIGAWLPKCDFYLCGSCWTLLHPSVCAPLRSHQHCRVLQCGRCLRTDALALIDAFERYLPAVLKSILCFKQMSYRIISEKMRQCDSAVLADELRSAHRQSDNLRQWSSFWALGFAALNAGPQPDTSEGCHLESSTLVNPTWLWPTAPPQAPLLHHTHFTKGFTHSLPCKALPTQLRTI